LLSQPSISAGKEFYNSPSHESVRKQHLQESLWV
jgi:hypothetical protein